VTNCSFRLPIVETKPSSLAKSPCCSSGFTIHQRNCRGVHDIRITEVEVIRYRCKSCGRTFTHRPRGVSRSSKSLRVHAAAVLGYWLGLSFERVAAFLAAIGIPIVKSTAFEYFQRAGSEALRHRRGRACPILRCAAADTTVFKVKGESIITSFIVDALSGKTISIQFLHKEDAETFVEDIRNALGATPELLITDDADAYKGAAETLGSRHQVCQAHVKKNLIRRINRIRREVPRGDRWYSPIKKDVRRLRGLVKRGKPLSIRLWKRAREILPTYLPAAPPGKGERASPAYRMRLLLTELVEYGLNLFTFRRIKDRQGRHLLDGTNNVCERAIGLDGKIRYRMMRGAKSRRALRRFLNLSAYIREKRLEGKLLIDLEPLVA